MEKKNVVENWFYLQNWSTFRLTMIHVEELDIISFIFIIAMSIKCLNMIFKKKKINFPYLQAADIF